jgi:hypothetical protein
MNKVREQPPRWIALASRGDAVHPYYRRVGGCLITGSEDRVKRCVKRAAQVAIPPQADAAYGTIPSGWDASRRYHLKNPRIPLSGLIHLTEPRVSSP